MHTNTSVYNTFIERWKNSWPPARPMPSELKLIDSVIKSADLKSGRLLVLGSTPEYRDLGIKNGLETFAFDINPSMLLGMEEIMEYFASPLNKKVEGSWQSMSFPDNYFDFVLAEQSLNILPHDSWAKALGECQRVAKTGAHLLFKTTITDVKDEIYLAEATKMFLNHQITLPDFDFRIEYAPDSGVLDLNAGVMYLQKISDTIDRLTAEKILPPEVLQEYNFHFPAHRSDLKLYVNSDEDTRACLEKYFKIIQTLRGTDFLMSEALPIYVCQKK